MKQLYNNKHMLFIGKSLLWSVLLYTAVVLVIDWQDVMAKLKEQPVALVKKTEQPVVSSPNVMYGIKIAGVIKTIWRQLVMPE